MSFFDELFDPAFMFDNETRQRRDIQNLKQQLQSSPDHGPQVRANTARLDQIELLCKALVELVVTRGVATAAELRVIMQQLDLADGVEDGRISSTVRSSSPRCGHCHRFVNPTREACIYCGTPMAQAPPVTKSAPPPRPDVHCIKCNRLVPERDTYFTGRGLVCETCFDPSMG